MYKIGISLLIIAHFLQKVKIYWPAKPLAQQTYLQIR